MTTSNVAHLGKAITTLGLEDTFLSNGCLSQYPLAERGIIAQEIISAKLEAGRWEGVVNMIYGGFGKADALFEGDYNRLKDDIVASARQHSGKMSDISESVINILERKREYGLLFELATALPSLTYHGFVDIVGSIDHSFFEGAEGSTKLKTLHSLLADKAFTFRKYSEAFDYFHKVGDLEGAEKAFDAALSVSNDASSLERMALSDPHSQQHRLKKMIINACEERKEFMRGGISPERAFQLYEQYHISLTLQELENLHESVTRHAYSTGLTDQTTQYGDKRKGLFQNHPDLLVRWAKKHATSDPQTAYQIFVDHNIEGPDVIAAVQAGLALEPYRHEHTSLSPGAINKQHLRAAYPTAPLKMKVQIASQLHDPTLLQEVSERTKKAGDLIGAYQLGVEAGLDLNGEYISQLRTQIIAEKESRNIFLSEKDIIGRQQQCDSLLQKSIEKGNSRLFEDAYYLAVRLEDKERLDKVRKAIVTCDANYALEFFRRKKDLEGTQLIISAVAKNHSMEEGALETLVKNLISHS